MGWNVSILKETAEIGYELMVEWQGKGVMQEVMPAMIQYGFKSMGLQGIEATPQRNDPKSWRILERFGFVKALEKEQGDTPYLFYFWGKEKA